jgi:WD40 repeat protein
LSWPDYQEIDLWDVNTGKPRTTLSEHRGRVQCVHYSWDGKTLVAASAVSRRWLQYVGDIRLWDLATGRERAVFQEGIGAVWMVRLSPDGKTLAFLQRRESPGESDLKLIDVVTGKQHLIRPPEDYAFSFLAFSTDGRLFVLGWPGNRPSKLWEVSLPKSKDK